MNSGRVNRRRFVRALLLGAPALVAAEALWLEPRWIRIRGVRLSANPAALRLVHFSDLHHKGNRALLQTVVRKINGLRPDFVCFTGDLVEEERFLSEALEALRQIQSPLFGVPGNHDYWSHVDFNVIARTFAATGGKWLVDETAEAADGKVHLIGASCARVPQPVLTPRAKNILLMHFPDWLDKLVGYQFDLVLAGHSHGGQVRLPFLGPVVRGAGAEHYDRGLFQTPSGPLYVNPGIGWFLWPVRFGCRPEITAIEI